MEPPEGPSEGADGAPLGPDALRQARVALRQLLHGLHVLDALPERSRMLAVDAQLPVHSVLAKVLTEQHPLAHRRAGTRPGAQASRAGGAGAIALLTGGDATGGSTNTSPPLAVGAPSPALPSNVLAEVCEFDAGLFRSSDESLGAPLEQIAEEKEQEQSMRRWTSPDDGWGMQRPMQDLEKMPMGMPVTVGELAGFLGRACEAASADASAEGAPRPPAKASSEDASGDAEADEGPVDMLDWSLAQWRALRLKSSGDTEEDQKNAEQVEAAASLSVQEHPTAGGPVLVHRVPLTPPRPILCTDDPDANLLKAVQLLLVYPELDALPIVSPLRCTVVAHLTLSSCLAYFLGRLRGSDLLPLTGLSVMAGSAEEASTPRIFTAASQGEEESSDAWAEPRVPATVSELGPSRRPWVLRRSQPLRDLLAFFERTHHSSIPIVEDSDCGGVLGVLSRRDLLQFLDLAMQSAAKRFPVAKEGEQTGETPDAVEVTDGEDEVRLHLDSPVSCILEALSRYRVATLAGADDPAAASTTATPGRDARMGASLIYEREATLKTLLFSVLTAENRKVLFVEGEPGGSAPLLRRIISAGDVWQLLLGSLEDTFELTVVREEPLSVMDA